MCDIERDFSVAVMKFSFTSVAAVALLCSSSAVSAIGVFSSGAKNVEATAAFPETNPFSRMLLLQDIIFPCLAVH